MWKHDAESLLYASQRAGRTAVVYDSNNPGDTLDAWKAGKYHDLIGNLQSGLTEGHTLVRAAHCLYYTNTPRLITRRQSEKRPHRIGQTREVHYYDFLGNQTLDEANLEMVRGKLHWAGVSLNDNPAIAKAWLKAALKGEPFEPQQPKGYDARQMDLDWGDYEAAMGAGQ